MSSGLRGSGLELRLTLYRKVLIALSSACLAASLAATFAFGQKSTTRRESRAGTRRHRSSISSARVKSEFTKLVERLRAKGAAIKNESERVSQPFFSVKARIFLLDDEAIQVFEYGDAGAAGVEAQRVHPNGMTVGTSKVSWMGPPHFYLRGKLIVLYIGNNSQVKSYLEAILGAQFAGG